MDARTTYGQFWRYAAIGLASNAVLYVLYLVLTRVGVAPKAAMTALYAANVAQTFVFNKRWSFRNRGASGPQFRRYAATYAIGYALNLLGLDVLVDGLRWPHELAQGILILAIAVVLFLLQKTWVFRAAPGPSNPPPTP